MPVLASLDALEGSVAPFFRKVRLWQSVDARGRRGVIRPACNSDVDSLRHFVTTVAAPKNVAPEVVPEIIAKSANNRRE